MRESSLYASVCLYNFITEDNRTILDSELLEGEPCGTVFKREGQIDRIAVTVLSSGDAGDPQEVKRLHYIPRHIQASTNCRLLALGTGESLNYRSITCTVLALYMKMMGWKMEGGTPGRS